MQYVLFGAGNYGKMCLKETENVLYFIDNDVTKKAPLSNPPIFLFDEKKEEIRNKGYKVVLSVSEDYENEIKRQCEEAGIKEYLTYREFQNECIKRKIASRMDIVSIYNKAMQWIAVHTMEHGGILVGTQRKVPYPEVTGYLIPSLMIWGGRDRAKAYAEWLCSIQQSDGSWLAPTDGESYVFDTAQIIRGLLAVKDVYPFVEKHILRACDYLMGNIESSGKMIAPHLVKERNIRKGESMPTRLTHIYCLPPLRDAGRAFHKIEYEEAAYRSLRYYIREEMPKILVPAMISHFHAYLMEGLLEMGERESVEKAMEGIAFRQKEDGSISAFEDVDWICTPGLFQYALVWYRLGDLERGNRAFEYACKLQNPSGGWYGSYRHPDNPEEENMWYHPFSEISWTIKFFLDALHWKQIAEMTAWKPGKEYEFIPRDDGRYMAIRNAIQAVIDDGMESCKVADIGCYHGRVLRNLLNDISSCKYYAIDLTKEIMASFDDYRVEKNVGTNSCIPYDNNTFDVVYACEVLEHCVDVESSIKEMARVTKEGGKIIIVDKNREKIGCQNIKEWEEWFDLTDLRNMMKQYCRKVDVMRELIVDKSVAEGLFVAWIGTVS